MGKNPNASSALAICCCTVDITLSIGYKYIELRGDGS